MNEGMSVDHYEATIERLDIYPADLPHEVFLTLGLAGEAGEVIDKIKKIYRGNRQITKSEIALEIGDTLWYLTRLANVLGFRLAEIMQMNVDKLVARRGRGTDVLLQGQGDHR